MTALRTSNRLQFQSALMLLFGFYFTWLNEISQKLDNQQFESRENKFIVYPSISFVFENTIKWTHINNKHTWILFSNWINGYIFLISNSSYHCNILSLKQWIKPVGIFLIGMDISKKGSMTFAYGNYYYYYVKPF